MGRRKFKHAGRRIRRKRSRLLKYLEWFGLIERTNRAANDEWADHGLFHKTPLFDRFLSFSV